METANTKRLCRKCNNAIPNRIKIDGVTKNLRNRKFCISCSPFNAHNTNPIQPDKKRTSSERNRQQILSLYKRALDRKTKLIEKLGGKCIKCGYDKCRNALTFHHKNPSEKLFGLSLNFLWSNTPGTIEAEALKCDLVCANCHAEIEGENSAIVKAVNDKYGTSF